MGVALFVRSEQLAIQERIRSFCAQEESEFSGMVVVRISTVRRCPGPYGKISNGPCRSMGNPRVPKSPRPFTSPCCSNSFHTRHIELGHPPTIWLRMYIIVTIELFTISPKTES